MLPRPRASFARLARKDRSGRLSAPVIAGISIAANVLITALVLLALQLRGSSHTSYTINDYPPDPSPTAAPVTLRPCQDLTIAGIDAAKELFAKTKTDGVALQQSLDKVIAELNTVVATITPSQATKK